MSAIGTVASGVGSYFTSGISYIGSLRGGQQSEPHSSSKMMGFGSDSYQGYMGGGSNPYDPPGGGYGLNTANGAGDKKWGTSTNEYKPMGNTYEKKSSTASGVPIV